MTNDRSWRRAPLRLLTATGLLLLIGCQAELDTTYGLRRGEPGERSINGTAVLAAMFEQAGHKVTSRRDLSPALADDAGAIVWFSRGAAVPSEEVVGWFQHWLSGNSNRTLVYVYRDYDAAPAYWRKVLPDAPADQQAEIRRRLNEAKAEANVRWSVGADDTCDWFELDCSTQRESVATLSGPWSRGVDPHRAAIELGCRFDPDSLDDAGQTLLASGDDVLVRRLRPDHGDGQLILVANGSFLLNMPLVNHEHRKLAARLVGVVGSSRRVVFLETGPGGPQIRGEDTPTEIPTGLAMFAVWPLNLLLLHLAVLGALCCLARWPIFGRPKRAVDDTVSDFGSHVEALGELLEVRGDQEYARTRLQHYQQTQHGEPTRPTPAVATAPLAGTADAAPESDRTQRSP